MSRYTVFGHDQCGFCRRAKEVLESRGLPFRYVNIHDEGISKADLSKTVGHEVTTVPQIFHGQNYVGGFDALTVYLATEAAA
ncbi:glutaredoxin domain-containing protein [Pseudomaricurvus sp. HS19]|uniref:glutaredoxin domain-containing protein n=1 Tax=Pseudomaricurvus sp. HS19 TaxID=2692626 RepID=UPI00136F59E3|nr:glutaredoxin domain-containing protein [Pseudomaricurvus sp. HS19]MYM64116.1 glutaredoxin [Pseudomaricurvus sp. HS19]